MVESRPELRPIVLVTKVIASVVQLAHPVANVLARHAIAATDARIQNAAKHQLHLR